MTVALDSVINYDIHLFKDRNKDEYSGGVKKTDQKWGLRADR